LRGAAACRNGERHGNNPRKDFNNTMVSME
jgi:hypothetical protein